MKLFKGFARTAKRAVAFDQMKEGSGFLWGFGRRAWKHYQNVKQPGAMQPGLSISEDEIKLYRAAYHKALFVFSVITFGTVVYLIYTLARADYALSFLIVIFLFVCGAHLFKYHFLLFQLKHPDHYVTPREWWDYVLGRKKS